MLVLVCGKAGAGKDTIGAYLCDYYGFRGDSLASPIKRLVKDIFVLDDQRVYDRALREEPLPDWHPWTVRKLLQFIGTEMFRSSICPEVWVKSLWLRVRDNPANWVVTDVRFPNELGFLKWKFPDCISIKVVRNGSDGITKGGIANHESEAYDLGTDWTVTNNDSFDDLYAEIDVIMSRHNIKRTVTASCQ